MNKLLQRQLRKHFGGAGKVPETFRDLVNTISKSYDRYEKDQKVIETSLALHSKEMTRLNSDLKKEKEELKKAHKELKTFFEDINEIVFTIDMVANRLIQTSAACEKVYGYSPAEFMSDNDLWRKIIYPADKHILEQLVPELCRGKPVLNQYRIIHKDGTIRWIENKIIPTLSTNGRLVKINGVTSDITERKQAEDKLIITSNNLQQAVENINKIMDSSLDVICAVDEEGYFIQVSAACETIWGYRADELIGKLMIDFVYAEDREKTRKAAINVIAGNNMINFENRYIRKDGSLVPINWSARWNAKERVRYGVARDATEKKRSEKALEIERQRFYDLFLKAPFSVGILKGPDHVYEMANPLCLQLIGKHDIVGKSVKDVLPEMAEQGFIEILDGVYKTGIPFSADEMLVKMDVEGNGKLADMYVNSVCQAYRNNEDIIEGIFFFVIDVTEQVLSRKKIEEREKGYRQIVETAQEGIWLIDENNVTVFVNKKMAEILEYSVEEMMGKKNYCFMDDESQKKASEHIVRRKLGMNENHDFNYISKSGKNVWTNLSTNPVFDDAGIYRGALAMVTDITERKKTEDKIKISELRYRSLVEQATDAICITDASMKFIDINQYALRVFGYTLEEALQLSWTDILFAEDLAANPIKLDDLKSGRTARNERRLKRKDGTAVDMAISTKLMEDGRLIMFAHDISERKKAEAVLKENEGQLTVAAQIAKLGYWEFDVAKNLFKFNDQFYSIFKTTAEKVGGYTMSSQQYAFLFVHPDDIALVAKEAADSIKSHDIHYNRQIEHRIKYANGGIGHVAARFLIVKNEQGRTIKTYGAIQDITDQKKVEEALINNELRFRTLTSNAPVGIFQTDDKGKTTYVNETWLSYTGMTTDDALGEGWVTAVHPDDRNSLLGNWRDKSQKRLKSSSEYRLIDKKGNTRWISGEAIPLFNTIREITGYIGTLSDITERKNAEAALIKRDSQLILAAEIAKLGYWEFDVVNDMFTFNDQFYAIYKTTVEKVGGYTMSSARYAELFVHPDEREIVGKSVAEAINSVDSQFSFKAEHRIIYANGEIGYVSVHFYIVKDEHGRTIKNFGVNQDITDRKDAEQATRNSEETTKLIMNSSLDAIIGMDTSGYITVWTPQAEKVFGWKEDEVMGKTMTETIVPHQYRERHKQEFDCYTQTGKGVILNKLTELSALDSEGKEFPIEISIVSINQGDTEFLCAFIRDITERKNAEKLLEKSQASLAINNHLLEQKNKELEQFAYVASHDMQEPLRTTSAFVELLQQQYKGKLDQKADKYLTFISQSSDRMKVLIKDLLDYSRIGRKKELAEVDCNIILNEVLADVGKAISDAHAEIIVGDLPVISGYPTEIKQLFQNLVINAIKFRKENTTPEINISVQKKGSYWEFAVKDNGIGMDEQHKERIFIIFQRLHTRNEYEGSGIGLAHCKKIVELHRGKIWVESKPGEGCTFRFNILENHH